MESRQYHAVVLKIPHFGTRNTTLWYSQYHTVVF